MMTWLHEQHQHKRFVVIYCNTDLNKADMNTNANGGGDTPGKTLVHSRIQILPTKRNRIL
jgi:hypothetical protein